VRGMLAAVRSGWGPPNPAPVVVAGRGTGVGLTKLGEEADDVVCATMRRMSRPLASVEGLPQVTARRGADLIDTATFLRLLYQFLILLCLVPIASTLLSVTFIEIVNRGLRLTFSLCEFQFIFLSAPRRR